MKKSEMIEKMKTIGRAAKYRHRKVDAQLAQHFENFMHELFSEILAMQIEEGMKPPGRRMIVRGCPSCIESFIEALKTAFVWSEEDEEK